MYRTILISSLLALAGCATDSSQVVGARVFLVTVPGAALPFFSLNGGCLRSNEAFMCEEWAHKSDRCVNPKGHDANPPIVACASINKKDAHE